MTTQIPARAQHAMPPPVRRRPGKNHLSAWIPASIHADGQAAVPANPGGSPYRHEMICGTWRGYSDTTEGLTALLIAGYDELPEGTTRLRARIGYATDAHVPIQATIAAAGNLQACSSEQQAILLGTRDSPPTLTLWQAPVPLVLVSSFYAPGGLLPRPAPAPGSEIIWINPHTSETLLESLHTAGWITLAAAGDGGRSAAGPVG
jgi:hypothetical protein